MQKQHIYLYRRRVLPGGAKPSRHQPGTLALFTAPPDKGPEGWELVDAKALSFDEAGFLE